MTDTRKEYIEKAKRGLDKLDAKIVKLEATAREKQGDLRRELQETVDGIRESKVRLERRVDELQNASKPAWEEVKLGVEQAWNSLSDAVNRAGERLQ